MRPRIPSKAASSLLSRVTDLVHAYIDGHVSQLFRGHSDVQVVVIPAAHVVVAQSRRNRWSSVKISESAGSKLGRGAVGQPSKLRP